MFTPKIGEDEPILTNTFQMGGSTTKQMMFFLHQLLVDGSEIQDSPLGTKKSLPFWPGFYASQLVCLNL